MFQVALYDFEYRCRRLEALLCLRLKHFSYQAADNRGNGLVNLPRRNVFSLFDCIQRFNGKRTRIRL